MDQRLMLSIPNVSTFMLIASVSSFACADVITVDADDPVADFATIQEAVDVAMDGDRIEVGPGYYFADSKSLIPVVVIDGKSIEIVAINVDPAMTVIAGQGIRRCVEWSDAGGNCKLDGFTLDSGYSDTDGGGLLIDRSAVEVQGCVFEGCTAIGSGGAIASISETALPPIARDCRFVANTAGVSGGGIDADGGFDLFDCVFEDDTSELYGGGIHVSGDPLGKSNYSIVQNCEFNRCESKYGGGVFAFDANLRVVDSDLFRCIAGDTAMMTGWGGGIGVQAGGLQMNGGTFSSCEAAQASGGLDVDQSIAVVIGVEFSGCTSWDFGGAVYGFGPTAALAFEDCGFDGNVAANGDGGAIRCDPSVDSLAITRCTFDENLAFGRGFCISAPNIVTAIDCDFNAQQDSLAPVHHVALSGVFSGSRFEACRFVDAEAPELASSFRATDIGSLEFVDCDFVGNRTVDLGGGLDTEGTVYISASPADDSSISFTGCRFIDNRICCAFEENNSGVGGGLRVTGRRVTLQDCVFDSNRAAYGGSVYAEADIINCIIDGGASVGTGGGLYLLGESSVISSRVSGSADCNHPAIQANGPTEIDGCTISGSFGLAFFCVNEPVTLAVCRLPLGSSVRDTRFCDYTEAPLAGDWDDLGGNSFNPDECNAADLNGDGEVNGADLALILAAWGQPCLGCPADVNQDGEVNGADLAAVLAGWGR